MSDEELVAWLQLLQAHGIGPDTARRLLASFGLPQQVVAQSRHALEQVISSRQAEALLHPSEDTLALIERTRQWLQAQADGIARWLIPLGSPDYPPQLLQTADPPVLLYAMGQRDRLAPSRCIAMAGSRNPTSQGADNARMFARSFARHGWTVVSGLALGIDAAAHEGALDGFDALQEAGAATIAVVGTGLDRVYPAQHRELAHRICQSGVLLSEFALGAPPQAHHFPRRNRILSGLCHGVLIVEAAPQSGSLITARLASEQGREVFAIPGSIHSPQSRGCHALIRQGAKLVESAEDVLEELRPLLPGPTHATGWAASSVSVTPADQPHPVLDALGHDPVSLDALLARTGMDTATLQAELLALELDGLVARLPGGLFQRRAAG
ncbi:DNA-processing protein DprA [Brachymonas sp. G13]|uniref:DNA-processing protein DprA n=1 Tax=Brachymonas wangyanguii TaxID=3130163 RepID=UPI00307D8F6C